MGWHDASIHGIAIHEGREGEAPDLFLDIDYIFKWVHPRKEGLPFTFWVAPCTLVFIEAYDIQINYDAKAGVMGLIEIADLHKTSEVGSFYKNHKSPKAFY